MRVSCNEGVASHVGPESCGDDRKVVVEALTGESAGRVLSLENFILPSADVVMTGGRQQLASRYRKGFPYSAWSETLRTHRSISRGSREIPGSACHRAGPRTEPHKGHECDARSREVGWVRSTREVLEQSLRCADGRGEDGGKEPSQRDSRGGEAGPDTAPGSPAIEPTRERRADTPLARDHPRQEPGAVIPLAGIRAGGGGQPPSLPRH